MKIKDFIINKTSDILSGFWRNRYLHNYKYCASVQITPDVSSVIKKRKQYNRTAGDIKVRMFR